MKAKRLLLFVSGLLCGILIMFCTPVLASAVQSVTASVKQIQVVVDGAVFTSKALQYDGSQYVPLGTFAQLTGKSASFDAASNTAYVNSPAQAFVQPSVAVQPAPVTTPTPAAQTPTVSGNGTTTGQKNALEKAKDYLDYSAFSRDGLITQLEFEGFSHEDAVYGTDNVGADWNAQAVLKAKQYLDYSAFSRDGLITQLEFEGFTNAQAIHGASMNGY